MMPKKVINRQEETINIPFSLAKLLSAEADEFVVEAQVEDVRAVGRALLRVFIQNRK